VKSEYGLRVSIQIGRGAFVREIGKKTWVVVPVEFSVHIADSPKGVNRETISQYLLDSSKQIGSLNELGNSHSSMLESGCWFNVSAI